VRSFTRSTQILLLADAYFREGYGGRVEAHLRSSGFDVTAHYMPGGKSHKTIGSALEILETLERREFTRDATLVALGGGVVGDVGGLVAALYFRGMNLVHVPSTITAQIDSAIGGKVAVNHNVTVNAIGTYYHPKAILLDLDLISDLPVREFTSGMAEVIKSALICDRGFSDFLLRHSRALMDRTPEHLSEMIRRTVQIKLDHVEQDPREKGIRLHLNYGHTIGQSIETSTGLEREFYRHGEAVALGMLGAARLADLHYRDGLDRVAAHRELLHAYGLPQSIDPASFDGSPAELQQAIFRNLFKDKKRVATGLRFVLLPDLGRAEVVSGVDETLVQDAIASLF
jgi:3-dehydroquinate synthase